MRLTLHRSVFCTQIVNPADEPLPLLDESFLDAFPAPAGLHEKVRWKKEPSCIVFVLPRAQWRLENWQRGAFVFFDKPAFSQKVWPVQK